MQPNLNSARIQLIIKREKGIFKLMEDNSYSEKKKARSL